MSEHDMDFVVDAFPARLDAFSRSIQPGWIHQALSACQKASIRRRYLPAEQAVACSCDGAVTRSIKDVCHHLDIVLQPEEGYQSLAPSVLSTIFFMPVMKPGNPLLRDATLSRLHILSVDGTRFAHLTHLRMLLPSGLLNFPLALFHKFVWSDLWRLILTCYLKSAGLRKRSGREYT